MDRETSLIHQRLRDQWEEVRTALDRIKPAADARPKDPWQIFLPSTGPAEDIVQFDVKPVAFNVTERANDVSANLFVVIEGRLAFRRDLDFRTGVLPTHTFSTKAAYFRHKGGKADHVFGAHYDFSLNEIGHPVFHVQLRSFAGLWECVAKEYGITAEVSDHVVGLLKNVRLPSAQMDVFSLFVQVCADHLLFEQSDETELAAFNHLLQKSSFLKGAAFQVGRLATAEALSCYRARHWYPVIS